MDTTRSLLLPPPSSTIAPEVDTLWNFLVYMSLFFLVLIVTLAIVFVVRYRRRGDATVTAPLHHNVKLEVAWIVIPLILLAVIFVWGARGFIRMSVVPKDAMEIKVTGQKWFWSFTYPEGNTTIQELVVPAGKPIKLLMSSQDVIHALYIPDFRIKRDVLPNRYSIIWFEAPNPGEHYLFCAEYCGTEHSKMIGKVRVLPEREYAEWLENASVSGEGMTLEEYGAKLYVAKTCNTCHSMDGKSGTGPTFLNRFGRTIRLEDGSTTVMDENYIRESILNPQAKITAGYQPVMPTFQGLVKEQEIDALITFIRSLENSEP